MAQTKVGGEQRAGHRYDAKQGTAFGHLALGVPDVGRAHREQYPEAGMIHGRVILLD